MSTWRGVQGKYYALPVHGKQINHLCSLFQSLLYRSILLLFVLYLPDHSGWTLGCTLFHYCRKERNNKMGFGECAKTTSFCSAGHIYHPHVLFTPGNRLSASLISNTVYVQISRLVIFAVEQFSGISRFYFRGLPSIEKYSWVLFSRIFSNFWSRLRSRISALQKISFIVCTDLEQQQSQSCSQHLSCEAMK